MKATFLYLASMLTAVGALLVASGIESAVSGWAMLGYAFASLCLLMLALGLAGLGCCAEQPKKRRVHRAPENTVKPKSRRKAG